MADLFSACLSRVLPPSPRRPTTCTQLQRLKGDNTQLVKGALRLNHMVASAQAEALQYEPHVKALEAATDELKMALAGRSDMAAIDPDAVVNATNPLHAQILKLVAEDSAMEDTLYQLGMRQRDG